MRRILAGLVLLLAAGAAYLYLRPRAAAEQAYIGSRSATAWNRLSQVREATATLNYGAVVEVLERRENRARVRTSAGEEGWMDARHLMEPEVWRRGQELLERARTLPRQSEGRTKVLSNLRVEPGRAAARLYQLPAEVRVEVLSRAVAERVPSAEDEAGRPGWVEGPEPKKEAQLRREDWLLVRTSESEVGELAGWVLGRFIEAELPEPLRDLGAGIRWLAWAALNRVADVDGEKAQYLGAGILGPEGQACDFTLLRVYTWHSKRRRYETAYVESNFCARLPVEVQPAAKAGGEAAFRFAARDRRGEGQREYRFRQNAVRRVGARARR